MLRVLTLNCWNISPPFEERMALIRAAIEELEPDVIGLQEIIVRHEGFDQTGVILEGLGYEWAFGAAWRWNDDDGGPLPHDHPNSDAFGNAVASRWPIRATLVEPLPGAETGERRSLLATRIETPAGLLQFCTTHLNWKLDQGWVRERQVLAVAEILGSWADDTGPLPPVVVGDLNAEPESTEIRFLSGLATLAGRSAYFQDAWRAAGDGGPGYTWDNRNRYAGLTFEPNRRIDYVLVGAPREGRGLVERAQLVLDQPTGEVFASDHFGLVVDLRT
jgi:endonuclease/exonuclease/phosphatase family metal-dependent hydrolase